MSKKHYSDIEKRLFINILKKFSHIIEMKKSDASTLKTKEDAWNRIYEEYNSSSIISAERSVKQLKKMWANMKSTQRDNLTKEKQSRMATGGGPEMPEVKIDPDIALLTPHLMTNAPTIFSSNFLEDTMKDREFAVLDDNCIIEDLIAENQKEADVQESEEEKIEKSQPLIVISDSMPLSKLNDVASSVSVRSEFPVLSEVTDTPHMNREKRPKEIMGNTSNKRGKMSAVAEKENDEQVTLKLERIRCTLKQENEFRLIKKNHETEKQQFETQYHQERLGLLKQESELLGLKIRNEKEKHAFEMQYLKEKYINK